MSVKKTFEELIFRSEWICTYGISERLMTETLVQEELIKERYL
jgi:hypothetical protein